MSARAHALSTGPDGFPPDPPSGIPAGIPDPEEEALACSGSSTEILLVGGCGYVHKSRPDTAVSSPIRHLPPAVTTLPTRGATAAHTAPAPQASKWRISRARGCATWRAV